MSLTTEQVRKIATLAKLDLSDDEVQAMTPQLTSILGFVQQLSQLDTDDVEPMTTALDVDNVWREDIARPGLTREQALATAPKTDGECFQVPAVIRQG